MAGLEYAPISHESKQEQHTNTSEAIKKIRGFSRSDVQCFLIKRI
jgi:hypothetical protein